CQGRQGALFLSERAEVQDEILVVRLQRRGEPRRGRHVADRLRAQGVDRGRRGQDRIAGEAGGALRMSVAQHLGIRLDEYDERIRTFIPAYDEMVNAAAGALQELALPSPRVIDLGTGTGALAAACARVTPGLALTLLDADGEILAMASA